MTDSYLEPASASLKARLRWLATDFGSETLSTAADRIEQLEAALTQSQDLVDRWINTSAEQHQTIVELQEALTQSQSQAEVAAAYERAADSVRRLEDGWHDGVSAEYHQHSSAQMKLYAIREIRALATTEQTAALDKLIAEAVGPYVEALRVLIDHTHECERELTEALYHADFCGESRPLTDARAILATIKKGGA